MQITHEQLQAMTFTVREYAALIETALEEGYRFIPFDRKDEHGKTCLLGHDIDASVVLAPEIPQVEVELGIRSTYFLMLASAVYNCLSPSTHDLSSAHQAN